MLTEHPTGNYRFLPGIAPYSCGVVASPGYEIVQVTFRNPPDYRTGFERIADVLKSHGRPHAALCAISLRSAKPYSFEGFSQFNAVYAERLRSWGIFVNGVNPVARTNVAPIVGAPHETVLYGFAFTLPAESHSPQTFVVAGAGELPEGKLDRESIVALGDTTPSGLVTKTRFVMSLMEGRLRGLQADWSQVTTVNVYTIHSIADLLECELLQRIGAAAIRGVHWHFTRPPIEEIEYEMDVRGVRQELFLNG